MPAPKKSKRTKSKAGLAPAYVASTISAATRSLINMVVVFTISGTVLLGLLAVKHF